MTACILKYWSLISQGTFTASLLQGLTQLQGVCDFGSLKKTKLFPTNTTHDGLQFFLQHRLFYLFIIFHFSFFS